MPLVEDDESLMHEGKWTTSSKWRRLRMRTTRTRAYACDGGLRFVVKGCKYDGGVQIKVIEWVVVVVVLGHTDAATNRV